MIVITCVLLFAGLLIGMYIGNKIADLVFPLLCPTFDKIMSKRALSEKKEKLYN